MRSVLNLTTAGFLLLAVIYDIVRFFRARRGYPGLNRERPNQYLWFAVCWLWLGTFLLLINLP